MFTGLIEEIGQIAGMDKRAGPLRLFVSAHLVMVDMKIGDSVSIDGACQTVVEHDDSSFAVESVEETLRRTTFGTYQVGRSVNLERSLALGDRLGGHLVSGHVDGVGQISRVEKRNDSWVFTFGVPGELARYIAAKGSIAVDGISLTVVDVGPKAFTVSVIPHTFKSTTIGQKQAGDSVNLEVDLMARYAERLTADAESAQELTLV